MLLIMVGYVVFQYIEFNNTAKAVGGLPWQDGGVFSSVVLSCAMCYDQYTMCAECCPFATEYYDELCLHYSEMLVVSQYNSVFMLAPVGFPYSGGGTVPRPGMQFIAGGSTNAMPWIIGIPGLAVNNIDKVKNWFNKNIIAGFKD